MLKNNNVVCLHNKAHKKRNKDVVNIYFEKKKNAALGGPYGGNFFPSKNDCDFIEVKKNSRPSAKSLTGGVHIGEVSVDNQTLGKVTTIHNLTFLTKQKLKFRSDILCNLK